MSHEGPTVDGGYAKNGGVSELNMTGLARLGVKKRGVLANGVHHEEGDSTVHELSVFAFTN